MDKRGGKNNRLLINTDNISEKLTKNYWDKMKNYNNYFIVSSPDIHIFDSNNELLAQLFEVISCKICDDYILIELLELHL